MTTAIRILIVDNEAIVREGLCAMLGTKPGLCVIGVAANGNEAIQQSLRLQPDVILMDLRMPIRDGASAIREIMERQPEARILVLSSFSDDVQSAEAIRAGAVGYILKSARPEELVAAIQRAFAGESPLMTSAVARDLLKQLGTTPAEPTLATMLTDREMEIARLIARGQGNGEIAVALQISIRTVGTHISHILAKVGVDNRTQLTLLMLRQGHASLYDNDLAYGSV